MSKNDFDIDDIKWIFDKYGVTVKRYTFEQFRGETDPETVLGRKALIASLKPVYLNGCYLDIVYPSGTAESWRMISLKKEFCYIVIRVEHGSGMREFYFPRSKDVLIHKDYISWQSTNNVLYLIRSSASEPLDGDAWRRLNMIGRYFTVKRTSGDVILGRVTDININGAGNLDSYTST
jgi:hypothetical protein